MADQEDSDYVLAERQREEIRALAEAQPLVSSRDAGFASLKAELGSEFQLGLAALSTKYTAVQRVRGDGNCFFRAFMFSLVTQLQRAENAPELQRIQRLVTDSLGLLERAGYEMVSVEMFHEMANDFFQQELTSSSSSSVEALFNNSGESEHLVWYARLLCAAQLRTNEDRFLPFLPGGDGQWQSVRQYCEREVEPQGKECEEPQIIALSEVLQVPVDIEYLSPAASTLTSYGNDNAQQHVCVKLLYRPGHYDVLW